jgi:hypothetical protein
MSDEAV